jgi:hypothetical protein
MQNKDQLVETVVAFLLAAGGDVVNEMNVRDPASFAHRVESRVLEELYAAHGYSWEAVARSLGRTAGGNIQRTVARHPELKHPKKT